MPCLADACGEEQKEGLHGLGARGCVGDLAEPSVGRWVCGFLGNQRNLALVCPIGDDCMQRRCSTIRHRWRDVVTNIDPSMRSFTVEVVRVWRPMVILRIHGKGTDNFSLLAMLLIYAYVPLIFLLPPSSSPGFVMIFFSIDELSGSTVLSLIMCLNLMHHTNYLAQ